MALATLHRRLDGLRMRRALVRQGLAWSALTTGVLATLAVAFVVDWSLEMSRPQRVLALLICAGVIAWVFRTYTRPWLGVRESDVDLALLVERNQRIDSDLVAALQFERPEAARWGSPQLESAVIEYVDDFSSHLNVFEGFSQRRLKRRLTAATVAVSLALLWTAAFPRHVGAFLNRMLLGSAHYPTATIIERIRVSGVTTLSLSPRHPATRDTETPNDESPDAETTDGEIAAGPLKSPHGEPLLFEVLARGVIPEEGTIQLRSLESGTTVELPLTKVGPPATASARTGGASPDTAASESGEALFRAELPRLVDSLAYQVYLGDAWTDPLEVYAIPLPVVTVELTPRPPAYAASRMAAADSPASARQIAVIEGSRVDLRIECGNKPLQSAVLTLPELAERPKWTLTATDEAKRTWELSAPDTPLADVRQPLRFDVQVVDEDGLSLERPLTGFLRLKVDRPPRVAAAIVSKRVVPSAQPRIVYGAADDFGIGRITAKIQVSRQNGGMEESAREILPRGSKPPQPVVRGEYALDLSPFRLDKGDELKITLEAFDDRGDREPKSAVSEPLVLQVTDREGILAGLLESDEQSAKQLDAIIQRELGIGESK